MKASAKVGCWVLLLGGLLLLAPGCNNNNRAGRITKHTVWDDMSPELQSVAMTKDQRKTRTKASIDATMRQFHDDWDYIWLVDRPLHLSRYPIP